MNQWNLSNHVDRRSLLKTGVLATATTLAGYAGRATATGQVNCDAVVDASGAGDFESIQAAVDDTEAGDTICVEPGTYEESVAIDKSLTLIGDAGDGAPGASSNAPTLDGGGTRFLAFDVGGDVADVRIEGFRIRNYAGVGIQASDPKTSDVAVLHNTIEHVTLGVLTNVGSGSTGARVEPHDGWSIERNRVRAFDFVGLNLHNLRASTISGNRVESAGGSQGGGIFLFANGLDVDDILLTGNVVTGTYGSAGIGAAPFQSVDDSGPVSMTEVAIVDNQVRGSFGLSGIGVSDRTDGSTPGLIENVTVRDNDVNSSNAPGGIAFEPFNPDTIIRALHVEGNTVSVDPVGILLSNGPNGGRLEDVSIAGNEIHDSDDHGIGVRAFSGIGPVLVRNNAVRGNGDGVSIEASASLHVVFLENEVSANENAGLVVDRLGADASLEIESNQFTANREAIELSFGEAGGDVSVDVRKNQLRDGVRGMLLVDTSAPEMVVSSNNIVGNSEAGIEANLRDTQALAAPCNYWGHASGPSVDGNNGGKGDDVVGDVAFAPWLPRPFEVVPEAVCHGKRGNGGEKRGRGKRNRGKGRKKRGRARSRKRASGR